MEISVLDAMRAPCNSNGSIKENQKQSLPIKMQAYERMTLFLERITPSNLLIRVTPISSNKEDYEALIIQNIENNFFIV